MKNRRSVFAYVAKVNGKNMLIHAYNRDNAHVRFNLLDNSVELDNVVLITEVWNKQPIEEIFPLLFNTIKETSLNL